jgi:hypothetical protein
MTEPEIYFDSKGEFGIDEWSEMFGRFPQYSERAMRSARRSEGYRIQQIIKLIIQRGGDPPWAPLSPHGNVIRLSKRSHSSKMAKLAKGINARRTKWQKAVAAEKHIESDATQFPLQKLAGAVRYYDDDNTKTITIGFLDQQKRGLAKMQAGGYKIQVTSRMRKMLFAAGMPLAKGTTELTVPPRPVVSLVFNRERQNIINNIKIKTMNNIYRYFTNKGKDWQDPMDNKP